jgi:hypothetical protein
MKPSEHLRQQLKAGPGPWRIGQALIHARDGFYVLTHLHDRERHPANDDLQQLREIVREAADGSFRPLKAESNLRTAWSFGPFALRELVQALDILYPTAIANWTEWREQLLRVTPFSETAGRQTGLYTIVKTLGPDQVREAEAELCEKRCLKTRLWSGKVPSPAANEIPLLCPECCSLFISTCRAKIKGGPDEA